MKNLIMATLILCATARTSHVYQFTNYVKDALESYDQSISDTQLPGFDQQKSHQLVQEPLPEEEPYPEEGGPAPPEEPYVPEEEPYLPQEDPNLPEHPYIPEEQPLLPDEQPTLPEQPFEGEPESW
jgi:hypothetical protein